MQIREVIKAKGYTIDALAKKLGKHRVTLSQNINSDSPSYTTMKTIADAIGCKVGDFFADEISCTTLTCPKCGARLKLVEDTGE